MKERTYQILSKWFARITWGLSGVAVIILILAICFCNIIGDNLFQWAITLGIAIPFATFLSWLMERDV